MTAISFDMAQAPPTRRHAARGLWLVLFLALFALAVRFPFLGDHNADIDEQLYALIGSQMWQGQLPFVDLWDRKPFGLFALFGLADATGLPAPWSYQLLATGFIVLGAVLLRNLAIHLTDSVTASAAAVLYIVLMTIYGSHSAQSEIYHVPAMLGMALLVRDTGHPQALQRALLAMVIGGLALQVKYTVVPQCVFFGLWALWGQYRSGRSLAQLSAVGIAFAALGLAPTLLVGLFYFAVGGWDQFWFANFVSFFLREPAPMGRFAERHTLFLMPLVVLALAGFYASLRMSPIGGAIGSFAPCSVLRSQPYFCRRPSMPITSPRWSPGCCWSPCPSFTAKDRRGWPHWPRRPWPASGCSICPNATKPPRTTAKRWMDWSPRSSRMSMNRKPVCGSSTVLQRSIALPAVAFPPG
jgi:hypothetical protein